MPEERDAQWYVIHTYSGYENKVKDTLERFIENHGLQDKIQDILIPTEEIVEVKEGKRKVINRKRYPGYVFVKLVYGYEEKEDKKLWYIIRNVRGVTGFVGPDPNKPLPLTDEDLVFMGFETDFVPEVDYTEGDVVRILAGPFAESKCKVTEMNYDKQQVTVTVEMFGRETPVTLDFTQVQKV